MSLRLRFSDQARIELSEIWDYIAEYNEKAADQRIERIVAACQAFTHTPELAATVKSFGLDYVVFPSAITWFFIG